MDPVSMAASVAGLVSLTLQVSGTLGSYCKAVKDARKDVQEIALELASMYNVLNQLDELLRSPQLKTKVFDPSSVLTTALELCSNSIKHISSKMQIFELNGPARIWEKMKWPFTEKEMQKILASLRRCVATFQFSLTIEGCNLLSRSSENAAESLQLQLKTARRVMELSRDVGTLVESAKEASRVSDQISEILVLVSDYNTTTHAVQSLSQGVERLTMISQESRDMEALSWLSSHKHSHIHHDIRSRRIPGTGQWLLDHLNFRAWMNQSNPILWCSGGPGVGKSVLTSLTIDHILEKQLSTNEAIAYFYFDYRDQKVQTPAYFLASLFRQLATRIKPCPQALRGFYDPCKEDQVQDLIFELCEAFKATCETFERCFIVIDALDECENQGHRKEIVRVLKSLPTARISVFVTSRPHPHDIRLYFEDSLKIDIAASEADIKHYCCQLIQESANTADLVEGALRQQVIDIIASKAHGIASNESHPRSDYQIRNQSIVKQSIGQAFENTIRRIDKEPHTRRQAANRALMWISHARRPLLVDELCHALATKLGDTELDLDNLLKPRYIIESCVGLIVLDEQSSTFRLVHYTLRDYMQSRGPQLFLQEETYITQILITYLCFNEPSDSNSGHKPMGQGVLSISQPLRVYSFFEYAAANWGHHAKLSQPSEVNKLALSFLNNAPKLTRATQSQTHPLNHDAEPVQHRSLWEIGNRRKRKSLHIVAGFGLVELLGSLLDCGLRIEARDSYYNTALHDAAIHGQTAALNLLLKRGAEVNVRNFDQNTPLYLAVSFSHEQLIPILLKEGGEIDDRCRDGWSPLHKAADIGHVAIARTLLDHGASVVVWTARGLLPLHRAAGRGHVQMVRLLVDHGSPIDMMTTDGWTPLHGASSSGQNDVVKILLDHNADIDMQSSDGRTALHRACRGGHYDVVSTLLNGHANLSVVDSGGNLPLHRAAKGGHDRISKLLLQQDSLSPLAQLSSLNTLGHTPQKEASCSGYWKIAAFLRQQESLHRGTNDEPRGDLELAIEEGYMPRVIELLNNGADVNETNANASTPLHQALLLGQDSIAKVLLDYNANITAATSEGWQPLHCAASKGMASVVSLCLDRQAEIDARASDGQTALHKSCKSGSIETVRLLLHSGADIEAQDDWGWRPLHTASAAGFQDIVEVLIPNNADLEARDKEFRSVQACAAIAGKHALVEYLRQRTRCFS